MSTMLERNYDAFDQIATDVVSLEQRIKQIEQQSSVSNRLGSSVSGLCKSPLRIIVENYLETATMTISPDIWDTYPLENVLVPDRDVTALTKTRSEHIINIDFDRPRLVNAFAMPYHTMSQWGKVSLELFRQPGQSGERKYDSDWFLARQRKPLGELRPYVDPWWATYGDDLPSNAVNWFDSVLASSARIRLYDQPTTSLPGGFDINMLYLGYAWQPQFKNFSYGIDISFQDNVEQITNAANGMVVEGVPDQRRKSTINLKYLIEEDANLFFEFARKVGKLKEFYISAYPEYGNRVREMEHGFVARFTDNLTRTHDDEDRYSTNLPLGEI